MKTIITLVIMSLSLSAAAKCNKAGNFSGILKQQERAPITKNTDSKIEKKSQQKQNGDVVRRT